MGVRSIFGNQVWKVPKYVLIYVKTIMGIYIYIYIYIYIMPCYFNRSYFEVLVNCLHAIPQIVKGVMSKSYSEYMDLKVCICEVLHWFCTK